MSQGNGERIALALEAVRLEDRAKETRRSGFVEQADELWRQARAKAKLAQLEYAPVKFFLSMGGKYLHPSLWSLTIH